MSRFRFLGGDSLPNSVSSALATAADFDANFVIGSSFHTPLNTPIASEACSIQVLNDALPGLAWFFVGSINPNTVLSSFAMHKEAGLFQNKNQFAQLTRVSINANGASFVICGGVGVFVSATGDNTSGNGISGYYLTTLTNDTGHAFVTKISGVNRSNALGTGPYVFADGDVYRLEGRIISPTNINLVVKRNGTIVDTITDDPSANFAVFGVPVIAGSAPGLVGGNAGAPRNQWRTFSCGKL